MRLVVILLRLAYRLLYHEFAWTYDLVAAVVSLGRWREWTRCALPYLNGKVLEIGFGPGHLQLDMLRLGFAPFGVDESRQMARQAFHRFRKKDRQPRLVLGLAQELPFSDGSFDFIVSTFPSEYIFDAQTLKEAHRVLQPGGSMVIIPIAWITGKHIWERSLASLLRFFGEVPKDPGHLPNEIRERFSRIGLLAQSEQVDLVGSKVLVVTAKKG
jgi:ubiquinone/menaquinone biosynthesis C-methylase UbiE